MKRALLLGLAAALVAVSCGGDNSGSSSSPVKLTLITHDAFAYTKDVMAQFTTSTGIQVDIPQGAGDAGVVLNKAILTKGQPEGDVLWGVDNTLLSRAVDSGAFEPYESKGLATVPAEFKDLVPGHELTPVDYGDVCINYDKAWFSAKGLAPPQTLDDLRQPAYKNLLVVENPSMSSPGLVFMLATIAQYGGKDWRGKHLAAQRREGGRRLDAGLLHRLLRLVVEGRLPARRLVRVEPAGRGAGRRPAAGRGADGRDDVVVLPPDRVRRRAEGHEAPEGGRSADRLPPEQSLPGGHAAQHVRVPGDP